MTVISGVAPSGGSLFCRSYEGRREVVEEVDGLQRMGWLPKVLITAVLTRILI